MNDYYKRYCEIRLRLAPFRLKDDYETRKLVASVDALADRAEVLSHGTNETLFDGWSDRSGLTHDFLDFLAEKYLLCLEKGENPFRGYFAEIGGALIDHDFVITGDEIHVFYNRGTIGYDWPERFVDTIGHAVSRDLINWDVKSPVLAAEKGGHDDYQIWSPGIIKYKDEYRMFYTGVNINIAQAPCMARSEDLYHWERCGKSPLFVPGPWCPWSTDNWSDCRDGMTFADDDGMFYMYYCSSRGEENGRVKGAMGMASTPDLENWQDEGCLVLENCAIAPESPYVMKKDGIYYMFYTNCEKGGTWYATSSDPLRGWTERGEILKEASCSEVFEFKGKWYISECRHFCGCMHMLGFYEFFWDGNGAVHAGKFISSPV